MLIVENLVAWMFLYMYWVSLPMFPFVRDYFFQAFIQSLKLTARSPLKITFLEDELLKKKYIDI